MPILTVIAPTTAAAISTSLSTLENGLPLSMAKMITLALSSDGASLGSEEFANLQYSTDNAVTWKSLIINGVEQRLSVDNTAVTLTGPLVFRVSKTATASAVGLVAFY